MVSVGILKSFNEKKVKDNLRSLKFVRRWLTFRLYNTDTEKCFSNTLQSKAVSNEKLHVLYKLQFITATEQYRKKLNIRKRLAV